MGDLEFGFGGLSIDSARAGVWARRIARSIREPNERIRRMYLEALGREPSRAEIANVHEFFGKQRSAYDAFAFFSGCSRFQRFVASASRKSCW